VTRVLLAGESWTTTSIHVKGFDSFTTVERAEGGASDVVDLPGFPDLGDVPYAGARC